jgi:hypothetical protein
MIAPRVIRVALQTAILPVLTTRGYAIQWDNVDYQPTPGTKWARVYIEGAGVVRETMVGAAAAGLVYTGAVNVDIFTPQNTGPGEAEETFDALQAALTEARFFVAGGVLEVEPLQSLDMVATAPWLMLATRADWQIFNAPG